MTPSFAISSALRDPDQLGSPVYEELVGEEIYWTIDIPSKNTLSNKLMNIANKFSTVSFTTLSWRTFFFKLKLYLCQLFESIYVDGSKSFLTCLIRLFFFCSKDTCTYTHLDEPISFLLLPSLRERLRTQSFHKTSILTLIIVSFPNKIICFGCVLESPR